jgi:hypothetical protein
MCLLFLQIDLGLPSQFAPKHNGFIYRLVLRRGAEGLLPPSHMILYAWLFNEAMLWSVICKSFFKYQVNSPVCKILRLSYWKLAFITNVLPFSTVFSFYFKKIEIYVSSTRRNFSWKKICPVWEKHERKCVFFILIKFTVSDSLFICTWVLCWFLQLWIKKCNHGAMHSLSKWLISPTCITSIWLNT